MKPSRLVTSGGVRRHTEPFGRAGVRDGCIHQHHPATPVTASCLPPAGITGTRKTRKTNNVAKKLKVIIVDDIDGTEGDGIVTHRFSLSSAFYEIDLCPQNLLGLRAALEPFGVGGAAGAQPTEKPAGKPRRRGDEEDPRCHRHRHEHDQEAGRRTGDGLCDVGRGFKARSL